MWVPSSAEAQYFAGLRGGGISSSLIGDRPEDGEYTSRWGPQLGAIFGAGVGDDIYLTAGVNFEVRGTGVAYAIRGEAEPRDSLALAFRYVTIPVGVRVETGGGRFFVSGAVVPGFLFDADFDDGSGSWEDVTVAMNTVDVSVTFGVGGRIPVGGHSIVLDITYGQSVMNLTDESRQPREWDFPPRFRARGIGIAAGFEVGWGGDR